MGRAGSLEGHVGTPRGRPSRVRHGGHAGASSFFVLVTAQGPRTQLPPGSAVPCRAMSWVLMVHCPARCCVSPTPLAPEMCPHPPSRALVHCQAQAIVPGGRR